MRFWSLCLIFGWWISATATFAEPIRLGVAWYKSSGMADRVAQGLHSRLKEAAPQIEVEWQPALPTPEAFDRTVKRFSREKQGMVLLRSYAAIYLKKHPPALPTFIGGCNNPLYLGTISNLHAPEGNITGVSYFLPYELRLDPFLALLPELESVLLITQEGHPASAIDRGGTYTVCRQYGIRFHHVSTRSPTDMVEAITAYRDKVSAIILGNQAQVFDHTERAVQAAGTTPILAYTAKAVERGALCSLSADDFRLGQQLGAMVIAVLVEGQAIHDTPVQFDRQPLLHINMATAHRLGILVPVNILRIATLHRVTEGVSP